MTNRKGWAIIVQQLANMQRIVAANKQHTVGTTAKAISAK